MATKEARYEIRKGRSGWYFVLIAANGEPVMISELYESKAGALRGIDAVRMAAKTLNEVDASVRR